MLIAPSLQPLASNPAARRIMDIVRAGSGEARIVGGAVRDTLLGRVVHEIDMAATLPPEETAKLLAKAGIKSVPTGIEFGTITAVIDAKGYEITTLRHDVETDGRRAKVAFTDDWQADAARRDFTMNALYLDADGRLYDYFNGQKDLAAGHVRFIGVAQDRIREDILRILRFFRFHAWFGKGDADAEGLAACCELAPLIPQLSVERVWREIVKLLAADNPAPSWRLILDAKILTAVLPEANDSARLELLLAVEKKYETPPSSLRRLAALLSAPLLLGGGAGGGVVNTGTTPNSFGARHQPTPPHPPSERGALVATSISQKLKLSKKETAKLQTLTTLPALLNGKLDPVPFRRALYQYGVEDSCDAVMLYAATHHVDLEPVLMTAAAWDNPHFPLQGQDLLKLGMKPGPAMGEMLKALEEEWIASNFKLTRDESLAAAKQKLAATNILI